jgi:hypothetical protein
LFAGSIDMTSEQNLTASSAWRVGAVRGCRWQ